MLGAGEDVDPGVWGQRHIPGAVETGVNQGSGPPVVFVRGVGVEDLRGRLLSPAAVEHPFVEASFTVRLRKVGKGVDDRGIKGVHEGVGIPGGLGEPVVEAAPAGAGHVGQDAVEDRTSPFILIEPVIEKGSKEAPALGRPEADGSPNTGSQPRRRPALLEGSAMLQECDEVAGGRRAQSHQCRILGRIDQLVDSPRFESRGHEDLSAAGDQFSIFLPGQPPVLARDDLSGTVGQVSDRQLQVGVIRIDGGIGGLHVPVGQGEAPDPGFGNELGTYQPSDGSRALLGHRSVQPQTVGDPGHVELPAQPGQAEAVVQQQRVSKLRRGGQFPGRSRQAEHAQHPLAAPVADLVEDGPVSLAGTGGSDEKKVGGELHFASPVARRQVDVADDSVLLQPGVDFEEDPSMDLLVGARRAEAAAVQDL